MEDIKIIRLSHISKSGRESVLLGEKTAWGDGVQNTLGNVPGDELLLVADVMESASKGVV
jgi:hypothetical protein